MFAEQVISLFDDLAATSSDGPWLAVASFVNPHDIAFAGGFYELLLGFEVADDTVPDIAAAPSQSDSFAGRPACQEQFKALWPQMVANQPTDNAYRRLYYYLHKLVDRAIGRILDALEASGMADDTIIVFTSDHGDLLGAHGGLQQKWANAFDEATQRPDGHQRTRRRAAARRDYRTNQSCRPHPHVAGPRGNRYGTRPRPESRSTIRKPDRCRAATSAESLPEALPPSPSPRPSTS